MNCLNQLQTPLDKISQSKGMMTEIIRKSTTLKKIEHITQKVLSNILGTATAENPIASELINGIHVMNFEKGRLILSCDNAAISTRLRYLLPELIHQLRVQKHLPNLVTIDLKIAQTLEAVSFSPKKNNLNPRSSALIKHILAILAVKTTL